MGEEMESLFLAVSGLSLLGLSAVLRRKRAKHGDVVDSTGYTVGTQKALRRNNAVEVSRIPQNEVHGPQLADARVLYSQIN
jgi:LPXTG-motif cell wall-anchored protein